MRLYCTGCSQRISDADLCYCAAPECWPCHDSEHGNSEPEEAA